MTDTLANALRASDWLKNSGVTCSLPKWVMELLPQQVSLRVKGAPLHLSTYQFLRYCAIVGTTKAPDVKIGQVSFIQAGATVVTVHFRTFQEADRLVEFGTACCMTIPASILRTAIMMGMDLPLIGDGVMSATRTTPLNLAEINNIVTTAYELGAIN